MTTLTDRPASTEPEASPPGHRRADNDSKKAAKGNSRIRRDIEGLRAVATFLVLPYHAGLMLFPGGFVGVDIFFVISGFVITGQLMKEVDRDGRVNLLRFYARRAKRLLPAASVVLAATAVMTWLWVPKIRWETTGGDIVASALYFVNWRLADRTVDYLAEDVTPSAVQHYWSLSVEEQYYFIWPILLFAAVLVAARFGIRRKTALLVGLGLVAVPSFLWAVHQSFVAHERAYFITTTRMWEFTIGAFVAILAAHFDKLPRVAAVVLGWVGFAMILAAARFYTTDTTWPGYYAALPTVGAGLMIAAGPAAGGKGPVALLGNRFMMFVGYLTYSLYLWHWPLLIVAREHFGGISVTTGLLLVTGAVIPAWLTFHLVENPLRNSTFISKHTKVSLSLGVNFTLVAVVAGLALAMLFANAAGPPVNPGNVKGSMALSASSPADDQKGAPVDSVQGGITPNPLDAPEDVPDLYDDGCQVDADVAEVTSCAYGPADAETTIAVVGDSKAAQWVPAFQVLAEQKGWRVVTYTKSACQFSTATSVLDGEPYETCRQWGGDVLERLTGPEKPDLVVTAGQRSTALDSEGEMSNDTMEEGLADAWTQLKDAGVRTVVLADTPQTGSDIYACVAENEDNLTKCTYDKEEGVDSSGAEVQKAAADSVGAVDLTPGASDAKTPAEDADFYYLDLVDAICPTDECAPVIGNVLVYRQGSHITKTYIETMAPRVESALAQAGVR